VAAAEDRDAQVARCKHPENPNAVFGRFAPEFVTIVLTTVAST
jgi:hypothetical protein